MDNQEIKLNEFLWRITIRRIINEGNADKEYKNIMDNDKLLEKICVTPKLLTVENNNKSSDINQILDFLNKWLCRISVKDFQNCKLKESLIDINNNFNLKNETVLNVNLGKHKEKIIETYKRVVVLKHVGSTTTSKILHIINPKLYAPWDKKIADSLGLKRDAQGYIEYIEVVKENVNYLINQANNEGIDDLNKSIKVNFNLENYYFYPKFVDEYYHSKYTRMYEVNRLNEMFPDIVKNFKMS